MPRTARKHRQPTPPTDDRSADLLIYGEEDVHRRIRGICFKTGPPRRVGAEIEWLVIDPANPTKPVDLATLRHVAEVAGPPPGGSRFTLEPGGQVELSSPPAPDTPSCIAALSADIDHLTTALAGAGFEILPTATDPWLVRPRQLHLPRYAAMEAYFDSLGDAGQRRGRQMMCATASQQVNVEAGRDPREIARRWEVLHAAGPTLVAAFANSPRLAGATTGCRSTRQVIWRDLDPARTHGPARSDTARPATGYADRALDAGIVFVREGERCLPAPGGTFRDWVRGELPHLRPPTVSDLDAHLSTMFPPVRARGFFEIRYLDTQDLTWWPVPIIVVTTLVENPHLVDRAIARCAAVRDAWDEAATHGMGDEQLAASAQDLFDGVVSTLRTEGGGPGADLVARFAKTYVEQGRSPADDHWDRAADDPADPARVGRLPAIQRPTPAQTLQPVPTPAPEAASSPVSAAPYARTHIAPDIAGGPMPIDPATTSGETLRQRLADELTRVRMRSAGLTTAILGDGDLLAQHSPLMSPLVWDLAHVGNYEELWLLREAAGIEPMRPEIDSIYDAFEHPRSARPTLPLLTPEESTGYLDLVRRKVLHTLETAPFEDAGRLLDGGFVYGMVLQHEHQHDETMLATHQLRRGDPVLALDAAAPAPAADRPLAGEVVVPGGVFVMGTSDDPWAYDNERPARLIDVPGFWIDTTPVSVAAYRGFVAAGGYDDERWWSAEGWAWRCRSGKRAPAYWIRDGDGWARRRFGRVEPLPDAEPVQHVCWFEADAYARWAGRRLPTEAEWEKAASWDGATGTKHRFPWGDAMPGENHANLGQRRYGPSPVGSFPGGAAPCGAVQMIGDVWEWTSSRFTEHPGFCSFPYREYSEVFHGGDYRVLRGGSWATDALATRATFRNWDHPIRRQIFSGFRTARDAHPGEARP